MAHSRLLSVKVNSLPTDLKFYKFLAALLLPNPFTQSIYIHWEGLIVFGENAEEKMEKGGDG